jgi:hypothetical protein
MDEILSYVTHNGTKFRNGGSNLLSIFRDEIGDEYSISLERKIYFHLLSLKNFFFSERINKAYNKSTYRSKGVLVFP